MDFILLVIMISVWALFGLLTYVYFAYSLIVIAKKTATTNGWMAWIPVLNLYLMVKTAGKAGWWLILFFFPIANLIFAIIIWVEIAKKLGKPDWLGFLILIPVANFFLPAIVASGSKNKKTPSNSTPIILATACFVLLMINIGLTTAFIFKGTLSTPNKIYSLVESGDVQIQIDKDVSTSLKNQPQDKSEVKSDSSFDTTAFNLWKDQAINYWNCTYWYSLYYPTAWANNSMTLNSAQVELYGDGLTVSVNNFSSANYRDLDSFVENRRQNISGKVTSTRDKTRNQTRVIAFEYQNPGSVVLFWDSTNGFMEMRIFGNKYAQQQDLVANIVAGLNTNPTQLDCDQSYFIDDYVEGDWGGDVPNCDYENDPDCWPAGEFPGYDNINIYGEDYDTDPVCNLPNGDLDLWWWNVSQEVRDCYIANYGDPFFTP